MVRALSAALACMHVGHTLWCHQVQQCSTMQAHAQFSAMILDLQEVVASQGALILLKQLAQLDCQQLLVNFWANPGMDMAHCWTRAKVRGLHCSA